MYLSICQYDILRNLIILETVSSIFKVRIPIILESESLISTTRMLNILEKVIAFQ